MQHGGGGAGVMSGRIVTVTLNPAIDQTVRVDDFAPNRVNRAQAMQFDAGGKGVNVASFLADYGLEVTATGFLGDANPQLFEVLFRSKGIADHFARLPGYTRTNVKIVDEARQQTTDINMRGLAPTKLALQELQATIGSLAQSHDWFVLSGNLPPGVPETIYAELIAQIKAQGKQVALDASQAALQAGVQAGPTLVKPNIHELAQIMGEELATETAVIAAARQLLAHGIELVVVSQGERGALLVTEDEAVTAVPPRIPVKSTVGAGDAMVAGLIAGRVVQLPLLELARLATAFSVEAVGRVGAHLPDLKALQGRLPQVAVRKLDR
jgi:1-phosphofructokinase